MKKMRKEKGMVMKGIQGNMIDLILGTKNKIQGKPSVMISEFKLKTNVNQEESKTDMKAETEEGQTRRTPINLPGTKVKNHPKNTRQTRRTTTTGETIRRKVQNQRKVIAAIHPIMKSGPRNPKRVKERGPDRGPEGVNSRCFVYT